MRVIFHPSTSARVRYVAPSPTNDRDMNLRDLAPRPVQVYVERFAKLAQHFGKSPERLASADVRAYLVHLFHKRHASWSYYNQALCALRFVYNVTRGKA